MKEEYEHVIICYRASWADEFDLESLCVTTKKDWEDFQSELKGCNKIDYPVELHFGGNEAQVLEDVDDFLRNCQLTHISRADAETTIFVLRSIYGHCPHNDPGYYTRGVPLNIFDRMGEILREAKSKKKKKKR